MHAMSVVGYLIHYVVSTGLLISAYLRLVHVTGVRYKKCGSHSVYTLPTPTGAQHEYDSYELVPTGIRDVCTVGYIVGRVVFSKIETCMF